MILRFQRVDPAIMGPRDPYRKNMKPYHNRFIIHNIDPNKVSEIGRYSIWNKTLSNEINVQHISRRWLKLKTTNDSRFLSRLMIRRYPGSLCCLVLSGDSVRKKIPSNAWIEVSMPCQLLIPTHPSVQNAGSSRKACLYTNTRYVKYKIELMSKTAYNSIKESHNRELNNSKSKRDLDESDDNKALNNNNMPNLIHPKRVKKNPRSRAARLSQEEQLALYRRQDGLCALCGHKLIRKNAGRGASLWDAEANHSVPHALGKKDEKPDQLLCPTCHSLKSAIEWHKSRDRESSSDMRRTSLSFKEFKKYVQAAHEASYFLPNDESGLLHLQNLIRSGNWRPDKNISHKKLADIVGKLFDRGYGTHHPVHNPQRLPVLREYEIFPPNSVPLKVYQDIKIKKLFPMFSTEPGTRFYKYNNIWRFSKDGKHVILSAQGVGDVASLEFDGRRGEINRIEWAGDLKVDVYVKSVK